jgi:hypothetical protein
VYIDKWLDSVKCGGGDDFMLLLDYFAMKNKKDFELSEVLNDLHLGTVLGKKTPPEEEGRYAFFWTSEQKVNHCDFHIPITVVMDVAVLLLQSFVEGKIDAHVASSHIKQGVEFSITAQKEDTKKMICDLEDAAERLEMFYPDFVHKDIPKLKVCVIEICNELKAYC